MVAESLECLGGNGFVAENGLTRGSDRELDAAITRTVSALQACLLTRFAPAYVSEAFVASRLGGAHGHSFGTLSGNLVDAAAAEVIERSFQA